MQGDIVNWTNGSRYSYNQKTDLLKRFTGEGLLGYTNGSDSEKRQVKAFLAYLGTSAGKSESSGGPTNARGPPAGPPVGGEMNYMTKRLERIAELKFDKKLRETQHPNPGCPGRLGIGM